MVAMTLVTQIMCSLGPAAVLRGPGLGSKYNTWNQDKQQSTISKACGRAQSKWLPLPQSISIAQKSQHQHLSGSNYPLLPQAYCSFVFSPFSKLRQLTCNPLTFLVTATTSNLQNPDLGFLSGFWPSQKDKA